MPSPPPWETIRGTRAPTVLRAIKRDTANTGVPPPQPSSAIAGQSCQSPSAAGRASPLLGSSQQVLLRPAPSQNRLSHAGPTSRNRGHYVWSINPGQSLQAHSQLTPRASGIRPSTAGLLRLPSRCIHSHTALAAPPRRMPPLPRPASPGPALLATSLPSSLPPGFFYLYFSIFPWVFQLCPIPSAFSAHSVLSFTAQDGGSVGTPCGEGHPEFRQHCHAGHSKGCWTTYKALCQTPGTPVRSGVVLRALSVL